MGADLSEEERARRDKQKRTRELALKLQAEGKSKDEIKKLCRQMKRKNGDDSSGSKPKVARMNHGIRSDTGYDQRRRFADSRSRPAGSHGFDKRKSIVCYDFRGGNCSRGDNCRFSHNANDSAPSQAIQDRGICYAFQRGECHRGNRCIFSHGGNNDDPEKAQYRNKMAQKHELVIIPILWKKREDEANMVMEAVKDLKNKLMKHRINAWIDQRTSLTPAEKYGYWEEMGIRFRMEIGPKEMNSGVACLSVSQIDQSDRRESHFKSTGERKIADRWPDLSVSVDKFHNILDIIKDQGLTKPEMEFEGKDCPSCELIRDEEANKPEPLVPNGPGTHSKSVSGQHITFNDDSEESDAEESSFCPNATAPSVSVSGDSLEQNWS